MIKILHIITRLDMGGSAQNTLLTCLNLPQNKYDVVLAHGLSSESEMDARERKIVDCQVTRAKSNGVKFVPVAPLSRAINPIRDAAALYFLVRRLLKKEKPDIVHTHTSKAGILGRWAAKFTRTPLIVHTPHGHVFYGHFNQWISKLFFLFEKLTSPITDHIITLTEGEKRDYLDRSLYPSERISTIHSGIEIDRFFQTDINILKKKIELGLNPDHRVVGTVGWLLPIKGPMVLLSAMVNVWEQFPNLDLVYVGKGPLLGELKAQAEKYGVSSKVKFLGWRDDVHEIMPVFDIFAFPSLNEGMGRASVEAMAAGKPVVASRAGGIPDLVHHEKNGLLVTPGDSKELACAIRSLLEDPLKARQLGDRGRAIYRQYSVESMVEKIDRLYTQLLAGRSTSNNQN